MILDRTGRSRGMTKMHFIDRLDFGGGESRAWHLHILSLNVRQSQRGKDGRHGGAKFQIKIHCDTIHDLFFEILANVPTTIVKIHRRRRTSLSDSKTRSSTIVSSNLIVPAVAKGLGTVLERVRVLGEKMFLSSRSGEDGDSHHWVRKSSLPVGGGTRISWGRNRGLALMISGVPGRVSGVRPISSSSSVIGISRIGRLLLGASEPISRKPPGSLDAPANHCS